MASTINILRSQFYDNSHNGYFYKYPNGHNLMIVATRTNTINILESQFYDRSHNGKYYKYPPGA